MRLIVLVPLLRREATAAFIPGNGGTWKQNRSLLHGSKLVEIPAEKNNGDATKIFCGLSKPTQPLIHFVQCPGAKHADLVDDKHIFVHPLHLALAVDAEPRRARQPETVNIQLTAWTGGRALREIASGVDGNAVNVRGCGARCCRDQKTIGVPHDREQLRYGGDKPRLSRTTFAADELTELWSRPAAPTHSVQLTAYY